MSKKDAGTWAVNVADSYFYRNGESCYFLIDDIHDNYGGDFSQEEFDTEAEYEISCW
ncbi:hypothetical protein vBSsoS008_016 [Shigella phage vB_SsoS_008]|nr:hypothetical protein vBSsoS008_016 [Shigella phage vB_SsoS_008]